jgi:hypothetical protein
MPDPWLYYLLAVAYVLACGVAWLTNLVTAPGNWIVVGLAAVFAWLLPEEASGRGADWSTVFVLVALAAAGEVIEFAAGAAGAAKQGPAAAASRSRSLELWSVASLGSRSAHRFSCLAP